MDADKLAALEGLRQAAAEAPQLNTDFWGVPPVLLQDWCELTQPVQDAIDELTRLGIVKCWRDVHPHREGYTYTCNLPAGHPGPCIGWALVLGSLHAKDRLHYRSGLSALPVKPYEQEAQS